MCDYRKNICGYITKKIIREFTSPVYSNYVKKLCEEELCDYISCKSYYQSKIEYVTGPSHIPGLLLADDHEEVPIKNVFKKFFIWFLKERYLRYLLIEGKMTNKKAYIEYKNTTLLWMIEDFDNKKLTNLKISRRHSPKSPLSIKAEENLD